MIAIYISTNLYQAQGPCYTGMLDIVFYVTVTRHTIHQLSILTAIEHLQLVENINKRNKEKVIDSEFRIGC